MQLKLNGGKPFLFVDIFRKIISLRFGDFDHYFLLPESIETYINAFTIISFGMIILDFLREYGEIN